MPGAEENRNLPVHFLNAILVIKKVACSLIVLLVILFTPWTIASATDMPFYWKYINVNIDIQANGDMLITETQNYVFTADYSNERYRYIPLKGIGEIADVTVQENAVPLASQVGIENNQFWIRWRHTLNAPEEHVFVLKYRVIGGWKLEGGNVRVYWKAIFPDRKSPVMQAKLTVRMPDALAGKVISATSSGVPATVHEVNPGIFEFVGSEAIQPQRGLAIELVFPAKLINLTQTVWQQFNSNGHERTADSFSWIFVALFWVTPLVGILFVRMNRKKNRGTRMHKKNRGGMRGKDSRGGGEWWIGREDGGGGDGGGGGGGDGGGGGGGGGDGGGGGGGG
ncbi:MAG: DUF2207 domain-containing protein [Proteobacteria bacterium]|nr:DUF2207 domain-containing protein [Pseudomonadota bacterium]